MASEKRNPTSHMKIRKVSYEYSGADCHIDLFFESAIRDFYGSRLLPHTNNPAVFIQNVELTAEAK